MNSDRSKLIAHAILDMVETFDRHPFNINQGLCEAFAEDLYEILSAEGIHLQFCTSDRTNYTGHVWLYDPVLERHYDAEEPYGATNWEDLPIFHRHKCRMRDIQTLCQKNRNLDEVLMPLTNAKHSDKVVA